MLSTVLLALLLIVNGSSAHSHHHHDNKYNPKHASSKLPPTVDPMNRYYINNKKCESYDYGTDVCDGLNHLWDCPETPLYHRNNIGRAVFQTPELVKRAAKLIKHGITYPIHHVYTNNMQGFGPREYETHPLCYEFHENDGWCDTLVHTNAIGNVGTQFDGIAHFFARDPPNTKISESAIFFNNFRWDDVFDNKTNSNFHYIGIEKLPQFFTRCILIDLASYLAPNTQSLAFNYSVTKEDFINTLEWQGLYLNKNFRFERGDVVVFRYGQDIYWYDNTDEFYRDHGPPGITPELVHEYLWNEGVMIIGADSFAVEVWLQPEPGATASTPLHWDWILCGGGFLHEALYLTDWANDAKKGFVPYIGVYSFGPYPVIGGAGGAGKPVVYV